MNLFMKISKQFFASQIFFFFELNWISFQQTHEVSDLKFACGSKPRCRNQNNKKNEFHNFPGFIFNRRQLQGQIEKTFSAFHFSLLQTNSTSWCNVNCVSQIKYRLQSYGSHRKLCEQSKFSDKETNGPQIAEDKRSRFGKDFSSFFPVSKNNKDEKVFWVALFERGGRDGKGETAVILRREDN